MSFSTSILLLIAASTASTAPVPPAPSPDAGITEPNPKAMSRSEIRAHNATLKSDHPFFIRCVKAEATGSLVKRNVSCRTNRKWAAAEEAGNREARDIADQMSSKAAVSN
jgi:hypothetical protein